MTEQTDRVGEIIEAGTMDFTAQCYELYESPALGSLVKTSEGDAQIYGIVCGAATSGIEPGRRPIARGKDEATEEGVYASSPQLSRLLRTEFSALVVGYRDGELLCHYLPPRPARIHSFVYACGPEEVREFSGSFNFLHILVNNQLETPVEEVAAAALRQMSRAAEDPRRFLVAAGKELAGLLSSDFNRLRAILARLGPE